ncbi:MAG: bacteriocin [Selenomonadaceae bacterium]|nr:bacteriocin [Selenomonadaceae bacterium]
MATRDENLKKINAELEKMSDEELEQVAGGFKPLMPRKAIDGGNINIDQASLLPKPDDEL